MHDYRAYGGRLRSALRFPELRPPAAAGAADWTIALAPPAAFPADAAVLGDQLYAGDVRVRLLLASDGALRIETSDVGDFDVSTDGSLIRWRPRESAREDLARFDLLGRVLPIALHRRGALCLHGSSVSIPDAGAVAFLAPKGHGKSTLALALAQHGLARLLSDDVTVLAPTALGAPTAQPGIHAVRLWDDSAEQLNVRAYGEPGAIGRKLVVPAVPETMLAEEPAPLCAIYLLSGRTPSDGGAATRRPLREVEATVGVLRQATAGGLLGGAEGARVLERAAAAVRAVPVYALDVARDFALLGDVAARVAGWHRTPGADRAR